MPVDRIDQAVSYARWLMQMGKAAGLAITIAAERYGVAASEVARRMAQRRRPR